MDISAVKSLMLHEFQSQMAQQEADQQKAADELKKALVDENQ
jgi:hypothetical protein